MGTMTQQWLHGRTMAPGGPHFRRGYSSAVAVAIVLSFGTTNNMADFKTEIETTIEMF